MSAAIARRSRRVGSRGGHRHWRQNVNASNVLT
jgi:hypothetical protein